MSDQAELTTTNDEAPAETPTAVVTQALARRSINTLAQRSGWDPDRVAAGNLLLVQHYMRDVSEMHDLKLEMVTVDVPPKGKYETQDLYTMQGKLAPTKHLLERISHLAGVRWDVGQCRFDVLTPECVIYTAVGGLRGPNGMMAWKSATKSWDLDVEVMEIEERAADLTVWDNSPGATRGAKKPATPEEKAAYIRRETARAKKHRIPMTESKARCRVMRALLGLPGAEDRAYWERPIFCPRIDVRIDAHDPEMRRRVYDDAFGGRAVLGYAQPAPAEQITDVEYTEDVS